MDNEKKITIRIPADLHQELVEVSEQDNRSLNGEIITLLKEAIETHKRNKSK